MPPADEPPPRDAELRAAWRELVRVRLPEVSAARGWPISADHCFARVLLDNALGAPWRTRVAPPAWRNMPADELARAIALGEAALSGAASLAEMNRRSLVLRGRRPPPA